MFNRTVAAIALKNWPKHLTAHATAWCLPAVAGGIGMVTLKWGRPIAVIVCL